MGGILIRREMSMLDIHTHLWSEKQEPDYLKTYFETKKSCGEYKELNARNLLNKMNKSGIEKTVVSSLCFYPDMNDKEVESINDYVMEQIKLSNGRMRGFCTVNPFSKDAINILEHYMGKEEFQGLKLHPNMQAFYPDDERVFDIYQKMQAYQKPILFHSGGIGVRPMKDSYSELSRFDTVGCEFPDMPIIMGHAGRIDYVTMAALLRKHSNIYADVSTNFGRVIGMEWMPFLELLSKVKCWSGTTEKLLFGSDYPFYTQEDTIRIIKDSVKGLKYFPVLSEEDIQNVWKHNANSFAKKYKIFN